MNKVRDGFSSKLGVFLAAAGGAVGLGNIWRFPYVVGQNGGGAFILIYILMGTLIGIPLLSTEFAIGRRGGKNAIDSISDQTEQKAWTSGSLVGIAASFIVSLIYFVIAGWVIYYLLLSFTGGLPTTDSGEVFVDFITDPVTPLIFTVIFGVAVAGVLFGGIKDGIEKFSKIFMPLLAFLIVVIIVRSLTLPGAEEGIKYIFSSDWSRLKEIDVWRAALGQAFFSITLGFAVMITYGSYTKKDENIPTLAIKVVVADKIMALLAALAVIPAVFAFDLDVAGGPGLLFITLPQVFDKMPGGMIFSILFFFSVFIAALSSAISLVETIVTTVDEKTKLSRKNSLVSVVSVVVFGGC